MVRNENIIFFPMFSFRFPSMVLARRNPDCIVVALYPVRRINS